MVDVSWRYSRVHCNYSTTGSLAGLCSAVMPDGDLSICMVACWLQLCFDQTHVTCYAKQFRSSERARV